MRRTNIKKKEIYEIFKYTRFKKELLRKLYSVKFDFEYFKTNRISLAQLLKKAVIQENAEAIEILCIEYIVDVKMWIGEAHFNRCIKNKNLNIFILLEKFKGYVPYRIRRYIQHYRKHNPEFYKYISNKYGIIETINNQKEKNLINER